MQYLHLFKNPRQLPAGLLKPLPTPQRPWSHIAIDFITDLPNSQGNTTILTIVDRFSKACRLLPLPKLPTAFETAELLCNQVFWLYGLPEDIVSDRGPQFTSRVWSAFFRHLNVNISLTSGYHPQSNGQSEWLNQEVIRFLRSYCQQCQTEWSRYLMWAEYAQNSLVKPATGLTPFQCVLGFQPPMFPWSGEPTNLPSVTEWLQNSKVVWDRAHTHLLRAVRRQELQANRHRRVVPTYSPGQWVWLSTRDLRLRLPSKKLNPRYVGPFKIIRQITPVSFRIELPANYRISPTFPFTRVCLPVFVFLVLTLLPIDLVIVLCLPRLGFCTLDSDFLPPAMIFACPATLSLPSLLQNCLPVFWPCLLVYSIKLLMDPTPSDVPLQMWSKKYI